MKISLLDFSFQIFHEFSRPLMHFARGNCGYLKAKWDNHSLCISCSLCSGLILVLFAASGQMAFENLLKKETPFHEKIRDDPKKKTKEE